MYKILERRHKRKADLNEDAIDQQTDSDESSSGIDSDSDSHSSEGSATEEQYQNGVTQDHDSILAKDAIAEPLIPAPNHAVDTVVSCLLCPGKTIRRGKMAEAHLSSRAHQRRIKRATALLETLAPHTTIEVILKEISAVSLVSSNPKHLPQSSKRLESPSLISNRKSKKDRVISLQRREANARINSKDTASKPLLNQTSVPSLGLVMREAESGTGHKSQRKKQRAEAAVNLSQAHAKKRKKVE